MSPFPIPTMGAFDVPTVTTALNKEWVTFVIGALETLLTPPTFLQSERTGVYAVHPEPIWAGDENAQYLADQEIQKIINALMNGSPAMSIPAGTINPILSETIPAGWLKCDGAQYDAGDYPDLFAALPSAFKSVDTFVVPNLTGRSLIGEGGAYALGAAGGAATHVLTVSEMPTHSHVVNSHNHTIPAHTHTTNPHTHTQASHDHDLQFRVNSTGFGTGTPAQGNNAGTLNLRTTSSATPVINAETVIVNEAPVTVSSSASPITNNMGSGNGHNNMPPYLVVRYGIVAR
jgi:microcystin-dependent protein